MRLPQGLRDEGILLLAHELGQRLRQGAPVALLAQGVQQDSSQVLGGHLAERAGLRCRHMLALPCWAFRSRPGHICLLATCCPLGGPPLHPRGAPSLLWASSIELPPPLPLASDGSHFHLLSSFFSRQGLHFLLLLAPRSLAWL